MRTIQHSTTPRRNPEYNGKEHEVFFMKSVSDKEYYYQKNTSPDAVVIANTYFSIEEIFVESFQYVTPILANKDTTSARYGTIIRESCNLYELLCRKAYRQLFEIPPKKLLKIKDFLSLESFFNLSKEELRSSTLHTYLGDNKRVNPFEALLSWDQTTRPLDTHIPRWWTSYNKIKHDPENLTKHATLDTAVFSMAAAFLVIRKIYGDGLISGDLEKPVIEKNSTGHLYPIRTSRVFIRAIYKRGKLPSALSGKPN
ncbi:hypothetical protein [Chryseolinea sp. H1M3-3]|uniref:hypothetical protein n=1 Tax=Chryseolinea sp. H1M3-3 TaxID=3034144 RepID=UPI0023EBFB64|nr:hypothetical protein [Chryseolinea sp. H1M3-3]